MPTIVATAGSSSANSYVTDAEADTYFDERLQASEWTGESDDDVKARALIQATNRLDEERYRGEKVSTGQALKWPRAYVYDEDGYEYATDSIPQIVKDATCELALSLLVANAASTDAAANTGLEGFKRVKIGPIEVEKDDSYEAAELPETVTRKLDHVIATSAYSAPIFRA